MRGTLVLDLDGTLVDSVPDLASTLNRLMASRGLAPFAFPEVALMVGDGARVIPVELDPANGAISSMKEHVQPPAQCRAYLVE